MSICSCPTSFTTITTGESGESMPDLKSLVFGDHEDPRRQLAEIFGWPVPVSGSAQPEAVAWAQQVLADGAVAPTDVVEAVAALRRAEPRLRLKTATYLAQRADE